MQRLLPFGLLYVTACGSDNVIDKQENTAPTITIMSHGDGAEVQDGFVEYFRAAVSDDDNEFDELSVAWYVGEEIVCDWETVNPAGESACEIVFEEGDTSVVAEVRDSQGAGGRAEVSVVVAPTEAPIVELLTPIAGENYYSDGLIQFSALVSDAEDESEELIVTWTSSVDGELSLDNSINASGEISDYTYLTEGNHAIELRVEDTTGKFSTEEVVIQVGGENSIPTCSITEPADLTAVVIGESVRFRAMVSDEDIPANELSIEWLSDKDGTFGTSTASSDGSVIYSYDGLSGNEHTISLNVTDEVGAACTAQILLAVGNPPTATIDEPLDGTIYAVGDTVTFRGSVADSEDQANQIAVVWNSDIEGELQSGNANSQGVSQFTRSDLVAGVHSISFSATDTTGLVSDDLISFRVNTLPMVDSVSLSPDPAYSNNNLSVSATTSDADGQNVTATYAWYEDGTLTSFTGTTINDTELDVGETWTVRVTPNDGFQDGNYVEQSITISNTDPTITTASISPNSNINANSLLTCSASGSDIDDGAITPIYTWTSSGGATNSGATWQLDSNTVSGAETITCTATVTDNDQATATSNVSITLDNSVPMVDSISITPNTSVVTNTALTCSATISDTEDGNLTPAYAWTVNGSTVSSVATYTVNSTDTNVGDSVVCTVSATDSDGNPVSGNTSVTVDNTLPTVGNVSITSSDNADYNTSTYTCAATVTDIDDNSSTTYTWSVGGTGIGNGTNTLDAATEALLPGDVVLCTVDVTDGDDGSISSQNSTVTLANRAPTTPIVVVTWSGSGNSPVAGDSLTCTASASTDSDGQSVSYTYSWLTSASSGPSTGQTVGGSFTAGGDTWTCSAVATDGTATSSAGTDSVTIASSCGLTNCDTNLDLGGGQSMDLVLIPNGTFTMGSPTNEVGRGSDEVQHTVTLTNDYYVMTTEVTQGMFYQIMGYQSYDGKSTSNSNGSFGIGNDYPAYYVSWHMAADFANKVTQRHNTVNGSNLQECYACSGSGTGVTCSVSVNPYQCNGYRMLTEAEWEYAARAGTTAAFWTPNGGGNIPSGYEYHIGCSETWTLSDGTILGDMAWFCGNYSYYNSAYPHGSKEVATRDPNDYGLYDMSGNLWEWTQDWYGTYSTGSVTNPTGISSAYARVLRGGSWSAGPAYLRSAERYDYPPAARFDHFGFRLSRISP